MTKKMISKMCIIYDPPLRVGYRLAASIDRQLETGKSDQKKKKKKIFFKKTNEPKKKK